MLNLYRVFFPSKTEILEQFTDAINRLPPEAHSIYLPGSVRIIENGVEQRKYARLGFFLGDSMHLLDNKGETIVEIKLSRIEGLSSIYYLKHGYSNMKFRYENKNYKKIRPREVPKIVQETYPSQNYIDLSKELDTAKAVIRIIKKQSSQYNF